MAITTYGDISQRTAAWAAVTMLAHAEPIIVLSKFGQSKPLPKNKADTVKFRRPVPFAHVAGAPLTEGVTPASQQMAYEDVTVQIQQYGAWTEITDYVNDLSEDPVLKDASMLLGEQAAETMEMITYGVLKAGTNKFYSNGLSRVAVNTPIDLNAQHAVIRALRAQRARPVTMMLGGSPNHTTTPIEGGYIAFAHTDVEHDIRAITGFTPVAEYGQRKPLCPDELGSVENVRYILTPLFESYLAAGGAAGAMISDDTVSADVYPVIYVGKEAYGLVPLKGMDAITPKVMNPDSVAKSDPLGQRGFVSWKAYFAAVRLNEAWMAVLEVAATAL